MKRIIKFLTFVYFGAVFPSVIVQASSYYALSFSIDLGTIKMTSSIQAENKNVSSENGLVQQINENELNGEPYFESGETEEAFPNQVTEESAESTKTEISSVEPDEAESTKDSISESTTSSDSSLVSTKLSKKKINDPENN